MRSWSRGVHVARPWWGAAPHGELWLPGVHVARLGWRDVPHGELWLPGVHVARLGWRDVPHGKFWLPRVHVARPGRARRLTMRSGRRCGRGSFRAARGASGELS